eukprot:3435910-Pyramimonas_sp.AAC.1
MGANRCMAMGANCDDAPEAAKQELEEHERELSEMGDYKTAKNMGEAPRPHPEALDFADKWSDAMQLFNACKRNAGFGEKKGGAFSRGLALPNKLWRNGSSPSREGATGSSGARWTGRRYF